ncbi:MAG: hypothetical protein FJ263_02850 [Planctomycetes bacterium]|nr:hypothetical protein [Planctomycetota bacterium]
MQNFTLLSKIPHFPSVQCPLFEVQPDPQAGPATLALAGDFMPHFPAGISLFAADFSSASGFCHPYLPKITIYKQFAKPLMFA